MLQNYYKSGNFPQFVIWIFFHKKHKKSHFMRKIFVYLQISVCGNFWPILNEFRNFPQTNFHRFCVKWSLAFAEKGFRKKNNSKKQFLLENCKCFSKPPNFIKKAAQKGAFRKEKFSRKKSAGREDEKEELQMKLPENILQFMVLISWLSFKMCWRKSVVRRG